MSQNLAMFILNGGHEVIGAVKEETDTFLTLTEPLILRPVKGNGGQYVLDFFPHSLANPDGGHQFYKSQFVSSSCEIPEALKEAYLKRTSNIILANALDAFEALGKVK